MHAFIRKLWIFHDLLVVVPVHSSKGHVVMPIGIRVSQCVTRCSSVTGKDETE